MADSIGRQGKPALVMAGIARVAVGIARCLNTHGITVDITCPDTAKSRLFASRAVRHVPVLPDPKVSPARFNEALSDLVDRQGYDILYPTTDTHLVAIGPIYEQLRSKLHVAAPPPHIAERVINKSITLEYARRCGLRV